MEWTVDLIRSFETTNNVEDTRAIAYQDSTKPSLYDDVLWGLGKRAFATFEQKMTGQITQSYFELEYACTTVDLIEECQKWAPLIASLRGKEQPEIDVLGSTLNLAPADIKATDEMVALKLEPYARRLNTVLDFLSIKYNRDLFSINRELMSAYFTLAHVDLLATNPAMISGSFYPYAQAARWFEQFDMHLTLSLAMESRVSQEIQAKIREHHVKQSKSMNKARHAARDEAYQMVTSDWHKQRSAFRSAAKAGLYYADWLENQGISYEPGTITKWIRDFASKKGIQLR